MTTIQPTKRCTDSDDPAGTPDAGKVARSLGDQIRSATLGTDAEGYDHHYFRPADAVVVYDADGVDHVEYLDGRLLAEWARYVDTQRGWRHEGQLASALLAADRRRKEGN